MNNIKEARKKKRLKKRIIRNIIKLSVFMIPLMLLGIVLAIIFAGRKTENPAVKKEDTPITASILSAGDVIMHKPFIISNAYKKTDGSYDYNDIFKYIKSTYQASDFTVVNFESTVTNKNYQGYPRFHAPSHIATALKNSNVDLCLLANNHIYDNGDAGIRMTLEAMDANAMARIGVQKDYSEKKYMIQEINGIKVGIFNYVYSSGSNDSKSINGLPVNATMAPLINTFTYGNLSAMYSEIQSGLSEMKKEGVQYTIAYIHWGEEYKIVENQYQRTISTNLCELGIDALIGGHPHVVQPVDLLTDSQSGHQMLCVYSLGNHLSNQYRTRITSLPTGHTEDGLMVNLVLEKDKDNTVSLTKVEFIPTWVYRTPGADDTDNPKFYILPLHNMDKIKKEVAGLNIENSLQESLKRTNAIIENGNKKIQNALPITVSK